MTLTHAFSFLLLLSVSSAERQVTIMTFNVQYYQSPRHWKCSELIRNSNADIILIQEDCMSSPYLYRTAQIRGYSRIESSITGRGKELANSILVNDDYLRQNPVIIHQSIDITEGCPTPRVANYVQFTDGLAVVNAHLCGGRRDDNQFTQTVSTDHSQLDEAANAKNRAMRKIFGTVGAMPITVVGGDFNGMNDDRYTELLMNQHPAVRADMPLDSYNRVKFKEFLQSPHKLLRERNFAAVYTEDQVGSTSIFNRTMNVPDWIYANRELVTDVRLVQVVDTESFTISDHKAIIVQISYKELKEIEPERFVHGGHHQTESNASRSMHLDD